MSDPVPLANLAAHLDGLLEIAAFEDYPGAFNGLQVENGGTVRRIAAAVDAHVGTLEAAVAAGADLLFVHHGLFWSPMVPLTGAAYRKARLCLDHGLAVYAAHLPLDAHPALGNTAGLARALGLEGGEPWFEAKGRAIGLRFDVDLDREALASRLEAATGRATLLAGGPARVRSLGLVTGGAGGDLAAARGVDTFVTGEGPHWTYGLALELGRNVLYGGHYATETFGVKAVAAHLSERFGLPWVFLDAPSGL
jgi:dinuclear metal center YbgI/SA1388 family protein